METLSYLLIVGFEVSASMATKIVVIMFGDFLPVGITLAMTASSE
jgi:hypothetical protein